MASLVRGTRHGCRRYLPSGWRRRLSSSSSIPPPPVSSNGADNNVRIPDPTWSMDSLHLQTDHAPLPRDQLHVLARRAMIRINENADADKTTRKLQQDTGNMMVLLSQVVDAAQRLPQHTDDKTDGWMYDVYRPHVRDIPKEEKIHDAERSRQVWKAQLERKTIAVGGHRYFAIQTTKDDDSGEK